MTTLPEQFLDSRDFARIARSIRYITEHFREQPQLARIAAAAGLSPFHFNRLFRRWAGVTPKQYLAHVTGRAARAALEAEPSVLEAAHAVGLSGPGRLHDLTVTLEAMTPGELKGRGAGVRLTHGFTPTPFGLALIAESARGIAALQFIEPGQENGSVAALASDYPQAMLSRDDERARALARRLWPSGPKAAPEELAIAVPGTNLQLKVWQALLVVGARERTSYSELAADAGAPAAARPVANAVGANPVAWLIPCHRVLRRSGALGGYRWGIERKSAMLEWEELQGAAMQYPASRRQRMGAQPNL